MTEDQVPHRRLDVDALKALAHPLRVQVLDALTVYGPQTASSLADRLGESSGATSYHLRQLERHGFVRDLADRGTGRERWWERVPGGLNLEQDTLPKDSATRAAARLVEREWNRSRDRLLDDFNQRGLDVLDREWYSASAIDTTNLQLTPEQLRALVAEVEGVIERFSAEVRDQRRHPVPGSRPVQVQFNAFPVLDAPVAPHRAPTRTSGEAVHTTTQEEERE